MRTELDSYALVAGFFCRERDKLPHELKFLAESIIYHDVHHGTNDGYMHYYNSSGYLLNFSGDIIPFEMSLRIAINSYGQENVEEPFYLEMNI